MAGRKPKPEAHKAEEKVGRASDAYKKAIPFLLPRSG